MEPVSSEDAAYLAGVIDGEGCITAGLWAHRRWTTVKTRVMVANTDERLMAWMTERFGGHVSVRENGPAHWKLSRQWEATGAAARKVLETALPFLVLKRAQALIVLELMDLVMPASAGRKNGLPQAVRERRLTLVSNIHELNRKGRRAS
jgi:hypothetical protein